MTIKGFITNLGKYNEGELIGKWIEFPIDEDDLNEVFKEIGLNHYDDDMNDVDTGYEEYFFTDWECDFEHNLGEYEDIDSANELAERLQEWEDEDDKFAAACEYEGIRYVLNSEPDEWMLLSGVDNDYDLGYYYAVECDCIDFSSNDLLVRYFDFESYGHDLSIELSGMFTTYGWIERIR